MTDPARPVPRKAAGRDDPPADAGIRAAFVWAAILLALAVPAVIAAGSPLLQWRSPVYVAAGFAGIAAMGALLLQPLLVAGMLPGLSGRRGRAAHRILGAVLILAVVLHVAGLWITSPPDMIDALTFAAPTLFSPLGVISMWLLFAAAAVAAGRRRLPVRVWRIVHGLLVLLAAGLAVGHAMLIEGTMGFLSKTLLCALVLAATLWAMSRLRLGRLLRRGS